MTTVQITLPDPLAQEAQRAGLLAPAHLERWLREQLQAQRTDELFLAVGEFRGIRLVSVATALQALQVPQ